MFEELVYFLRDGLFTDFVSDLAGYFFRKDFFRIHLNQNQINVREDNRYENRIIIGDSFSVFSTHLAYAIKELIEFLEETSVLDILLRLCSKL